MVSSDGFGTVYVVSRPLNIFWFRRDLRLSGNEALECAARAGDVLPVFVLDPRYARTMHTPRGTYLTATLSALDTALDGTLICTAGDPASEITRLAQAVRSRTSPATRVRVFATASHTPAGAARDSHVAAALRSIGVEFIPVGAPYASTGEIRAANGALHRVFTPYKNRWCSAVASKSLSDDTVSATFVDLDPGTNTTAHQLQSIPEEHLVWYGPTPVGERAARACRDGFLENSLRSYATERDLCAQPATSRLGAALHIGAIHPLQILPHLNLGDASSALFASELCWRDFYAEWGSTPNADLWSPMDRRFEKLAVDAGKIAVARFVAWRNGQTGFPLVDAGMRQLLTTGWMHNRTRMITASFLVKHLHLPWQWGARWFLDHLVDGDLASNNLSFQWVAGCGVSAAPFFRIINPIRQGETFDPDGSYVRTWVRELEDEPASTIHQPLPAGTRRAAGASYPSPIVDLSTERADALGRFAALST